YTDAARLSEQEIGFYVLEAVIRHQPADQFTIGDSGRILHWTRGPDGHQEALGLKTGPADRPGLDQIHLNGRGGRDFHGDAAQLTVALPAMAIAEKQIGALGLHRKVGYRPRRDIGKVHVAAPIVRLQRKNRFDLRADAERANEWIEWQRDLVVEANALFRDHVFHHPLGQGRVQHRRPGVPDQAAEFRYEGRCPDRLWSTRDNPFDPHAKHVAPFRALDEDGPILRIDEGHLELLRGSVVDRLDRAPESVQCLSDHHVARRDRQDWVGISSIDVLVRPLCRLGQMMLLADASTSNTLPRHIGGGKPIRHRRLPQNVKGISLPRCPGGSRRLWISAIVRELETLRSSRRTSAFWPLAEVRRTRRVHWHSITRNGRRGTGAAGLVGAHWGGAPAAGPA